MMFPIKGGYARKPLAIIVNGLVADGIHYVFLFMVVNIMFFLDNVWMWFLMVLKWFKMLLFLEEDVWKLFVRVRGERCPRLTAYFFPVRVGMRLA